MTTVSLVSPVDGSVYLTRETLTFSAAEGAVARARAAQRAWSATPLAQRVAAVRAGVDALAAMNDAVVPELAWQMGRPVRYGGELGGTRERTDYMTGIAADALAPHVVEQSAAMERRIERVPHGVVLVIAPWNYPFMTAINTIIPALVAGNAVILKHASQTLQVGERLQAAFDAGGLPPEVFCNLVLDHDTTARLIAAGHFGFVNFTGSVAGGQAIERAAAGTFTATGLELGGKDPGYVMEDADLDWAADVLMDGAMYNAGQCCCGIERIYVHRRLYDGFVDRAVAFAEALTLGNPLDPETTLGPMAAPRFAKLVRDHVAEATAQGARQLVDPATFPADDGAAYLAPTVLVDVTHDMRVMREESFGPVVGIMPVDDDDQALALMNDSDFGLTASLWTGDAARAAAIGRRIETGTVFLNRADYLDPAVCWTGCKATGRGAALSHLGYHAVTRPRSFHFRKQKG